MTHSCVTMETLFVWLRITTDWGWVLSPQQRRFPPGMFSTTHAQKTTCARRKRRLFRATVHEHTILLQLARIPESAFFLEWAEQSRCARQPQLLASAEAGTPCVTVHWECASVTAVPKSQKT